MAKLMMATIRIRGNPGPTGRSRRCSAGQPRYEFGGGAQGSCMVTPLMRHQDTTTSWMSAPPAPPRRVTGPAPCQASQVRPDSRQNPELQLAS